MENAYSGSQKVVQEFSSRIFCRTRTLDLWAAMAPKNGPMNLAAHSSTGGAFSSTASWKSHLRMDFSERLSFSPTTAVPSRNCLRGKEGRTERREGWREVM